MIDSPPQPQPRPAGLAATADPRPSVTTPSWRDPGVLAVVVVGLIARVGWAAWIPVQPVSDCYAYEAFARNIVAGVGYAWHPGELTAYWPVGTSALYSLVFLPPARGYGAVVVLNLLMGLAVIALTMGLARAWFDRRVAIRAGLVLALWPLLIEYTTIIASELPFLVAMLGAWLALPGPAAARIGWRRSIVSGVLLAAASFIRPTALLLPVVFAIPSSRLREARRPALARALISTVVMVACILPWSYRNYRVFGEFVLISTNGKVNTWMGNNPLSNGGYMTLPERVSGLSEVERERVLGAEARGYILENVPRFAWRSVVKAARLHERESIGIAWNEPGMASRMGRGGIFAIKLGSNIYWWLILALGLGGFVILARRSGLVTALFHPTVICWTYFTAVHAATVIQDRYHMAFIPCIAILAGHALACWEERRDGAVSPAHAGLGERV